MIIIFINLIFGKLFIFSLQGGKIRLKKLLIPRRPSSLLWPFLFNNDISILNNVMIVIFRLFIAEEGPIYFKDWSFIDGFDRYHALIAIWICTLPYIGLFYVHVFLVCIRFLDIAYFIGAEKGAI